MKNRLANIIFPLIIFLCLSVITIVLWHDYTELDEEIMRRHTETMVEQIHMRLEDFMEERLSSLEVLVDRWVERRPPDFSYTRYRQFAETYCKYYPGFQAINWVDTEGFIRWVYPEKQNYAAKDKNLHNHPETAVRKSFARAEKDRKYTITPWVKLFQGGLGFATYWPLIYDGKMQGYINAVFNISSLVKLRIGENIFDEFRLALFEGDRLIYQQGFDKELMVSNPSVRAMREIHFREKIWRLELEPLRITAKNGLASYLGLENPTLLVFLFFGLMLSTGLSFLLYSFMHRMQMYMVARDQALYEVNERKQAEERLQKTRDYLDKLIQYANAPIIVWDPDLKITRFNRAFEHFTGYEAEEVMGRALSSLFPETSRDESLQKIARTSRGEYWESVEIPILRRNGEVWLALWNSANIYAEDKTTLMATIAQGIDITKRKRAEQEIQNLQLYNRGLIETNLDPLVTFDHKGIILDVNEATVKATGRTPEKLIGTPFADYFTDPEKAHKGAMLVFETGEVRDYDLVIKGDGSETIVSYNASVYKDQTGQVIGAFAAARNITDQRNLEHEREVLLKELSDKNAELESFVYTVSHDLKTPIVTIEGFIGALREDFGNLLGQEGERYLKRISDATRKMEGLINDLLNLSRIGRISEKKREISFADLVKEAVKSLYPQINERGITIEIPEDMPSLYGEKKRLEQVVDNLMANGVKYIGKDNPSPRIEVGAEKQGDETVCFVRDNGIGIDRMYFDKVFNIFQRLPSAKKIDGTGMGLTIVKRIIEMHGGRVWVESDTGKGSTFYFTIPLKTRRIKDDF
jgi:PAS domain S-box-containing protein